MATQPPHPRTFARGTRNEIDDPTGVRAIVYAPAPERQRWVEQELIRKSTIIQVGRSVSHLVAALVEDPAPRPQVLVIDLDALDAGELFHLHQIRERGWCGTIVALGRVPHALRASLGIDTVIAPPFVEDALGEAIAKHREDLSHVTVPIPLPLL